MTNEEFLAAFEPLVGAPGGIKRLRGIILDLAFRGRLADACSDSGDEVCVHTRQDRLRVARELGVRVPQDLPPVRPEEVPFLVPAHWAWERIGNLGVVVGGATPNSQRSDFFAGSEGIPWITPADMSRQSNRLVSGGKRFLSDLGLASCSATLMPAGTILFSSRAPVGHVGIAACPIATNQGFKSLVPSNGMRSEFLYYAFRWALPMFESVASGTTFLEVSGAVFAKVILPIPPLAEQERIVERVDELMVLCDALEAEQAHAESLRTATAKSAFSILVESALTDPTRAQRVLSEHFDAVLEPGSNAVEVVGELRKTILDLAVGGALISSATGSLFSEGKRSQIESPTPAQSRPLDEAFERRFGASEAWRSVALGDIANITTGSLDANAAVPGGAFPFFTCSTLISSIDAAAFDQEAVLLSGNGFFHARYFHGKFNAYQRVYVIGAATSEVSVRYLHVFLQHYRASFEALSGGGVIRYLRLPMIRDAIVPLPSRGIQDRIVEAVTVLLTLCDDLEAAFLEERALASALGGSVASALRT